MKIVPSLALMASFVSISGCSTAPENQFLDVPMVATHYNTGRLASAILAPKGNETSIWIYVRGVPNNTAIPAHLYTHLYSGTCGNLSESPAYSMNNTVYEDLLEPTIKLSKIAPLPLDSLRTGRYALVVRASPADGNNDLFCGNIL
ncbi:hypothetical protein [Pseudomonas sp. NFX224]|uniref:hypothetical protein n=1 Tax=Pseudomonas sp. NFX224 TaxID=3402862 RepID=UPI003AFA34E8